MALSHGHYAAFSDLMIRPASFNHYLHLQAFPDFAKITHTTFMLTECYTIQEIAKDLKISVEWARELLQDYPGVVKLGSVRSSRRGHGYKRKYTTLRVPKAVYQRFVAERYKSVGK